MPSRSDSEMMSLYEAAYRPARPGLRGALLSLWTFAALLGLNLFCWAEPWSAGAFAALKASGVSAPLVDYLLVPLWMFFRAVLLVEAFGYVYHRFFQHLGRMTRQSAVFRRNQMFHWVHHMIIYPIGRFYKKDAPYVASEEGIAWSWTAPALIAGGVAFWLMGPTLACASFLAGIGIYAKFIVDVTHSRFHVVKHPWAESRYFHWLEDIHILHHWDQRFNFTIVFPLMDALCGTYLSPAKYEKERRLAMEDSELTISDLINWRYLLLEATPAEYASFISQARRHTRSMRKVGLLLEVFSTRMRLFPGDAYAAELHRRTVDLIGAIEAEKKREAQAAA